MVRRLPAVLLSAAALAGLVAACGSSSAEVPFIPASGFAAGTTPDAGLSSVDDEPTVPASHALLRQSGSGIANTAEFTVTAGSFQVGYHYDCATFGYPGNFAVDLEQGGNEVDLLVNTLGMSAQDAALAYDGPGTFHLAIDSECSWSVAVVGY